MTSVTVDSLLKGIGCNMMATAPKDLYPEECLADLSLHLLQNPKSLVLAIGAIRAHARLWHPELLLKTIKNRPCDPFVIGALLSKTQDRRFQKVIAFCRVQKVPPAKPSKIMTLSLDIGQSAEDSEFLKFGIRISSLNAVDDKKLSKTALFMRNSLFIRHRLLFGCGWRADVISAMQMGFQNPTAIKNRLGCSYETAHRVFNDYTLYQRANLRPHSA